MVKREIFAEIRIVVSEETGISVDAITSKSKTEEVVDARYILVQLLHERGLYASMIASLVGLQKRTVNHIVSGFEARAARSQIMWINYTRCHARAMGH